jgi:hypothetical protein
VADESLPAGSSLVLAAAAFVPVRESRTAGVGCHRPEAPRAESDGAERQGIPSTIGASSQSASMRTKTERWTPDKG